MSKIPYDGELPDMSQILTSFPNNNMKHIDYVIVYEEPRDRLDEQDLKIIQKRKEFFENLKENSFELVDLEVDIGNGKKRVFSLLHCPLNRLLQEAEHIRLEMRLKNVIILVFQGINGRTVKI